MADLALIWDASALAADLLVVENDLAQDDGLRTAVLISLFTDRRAEPGDSIPDEQTDMRGWWGDALPVVDGDRIGSRLWLLSRSKQTPGALALAEAYAREALEWLIEDLVATRVEVTATFPARGVFGLEVAIWRPGQDSPAVYHFNDVWAGEAG